MKYKGKTITLRPDGRWWTRYYSDGKQKSVYGRTQKECLANLKKALTTIEAKKNTTLKYSFFDWLDVWNKTYKLPYNKTDMITGQIRNHIKSNIKDKPLSEVTSIDLQEIINKIPKKQTRTKEDIYNIFTGCFEKAVDNRLIKYNPTDCLDKPKHIRKKGEALTRAEEKIFLDAIKNTPCEKFFLFILFTGCRRGEALNIREEDIDWIDKKIKIRGTKTESSKRTIPLFSAAEKLLKKIETTDGFYFTHEKDYPTHEFKEYCPGEHKLHDLRHTFSTRCLEQGIAMKTVQKWLGHSDYRTTANIYSSVQGDFIKEQAQKLNNYFDTYFDT